METLFPFNQDNFHEVMARKPFTFAVVRHPHERLVSAYIDFTERDFVNSSFVDFLKDHVLREAENCVRGGSCHMNRHWIPMDNICSFCALNYSLVGTMETFGEDHARVSGLLGVEVAESSKERHVHTGPSAIQEVTAAHFALVPETVLRRVNQVYKLDLEMFGYQPYPGAASQM